MAFKTSSNMDKTERKAELFIESLLKEGAFTSCDDSVECFKNDGLPPFYDDELFKQGQQFYHKHIFGIFSGKLFGLLSILSVPSILKILIHTRMSGSSMTAYRRYLATILHMTIWYDSDFKPGSKLWRSISEVKNFHNSASNLGCKTGLGRISQKDMALTQFGFMGFQLIRSEMLGVHNASEDEWIAFIHLWRVVGHILGIEDRFNLCRGSVEETKAICEKLVEQIFLPNIRKKDPDFIQMSKYMVDGLWAVQPILNFNVVMCAINVLLTNNINNNENEEFNNLTVWEKTLLYFIGLIFYSLRWTPFRWYFNLTAYRDLWLMKHFPFLAYYKFGFKKSHVQILGKYE